MTGINRPISSYRSCRRNHEELRENNLPQKSSFAERKATLISAQRLNRAITRWHLLAEEWQAAALRADIARLEAWQRERRFDHRHWDMLRYYHDRLGLERFWRLAREHSEFDDLTLALRSELRRELMTALEESADAGPAPRQKALAGTGLIEIGATEDKPRNAAPRLRTVTQGHAGEIPVGSCA